MPRVTPETVEHVARLARLALTPQECETFAPQLERILAFAEAIQALDTEGTEPMVHPGASVELRPDEPRPGLERETAVATAPDAGDGLFFVPRVIGG